MATCNHCGADIDVQNGDISSVICFDGDFYCNETCEAAHRNNGSSVSRGFVYTGPVTDTAPSGSNERFIDTEGPRSRYIDSEGPATLSNRGYDP